MKDDMMTNTSIVSFLTECSVEAENIFCENILESSGKKMLHFFCEIGCQKAYMVIAEDEGTVSFLDGIRTIYLKSEQFIDCLPILFKSAEPSKFTEAELQHFLQQIDQKKNTNSLLSGLYFGIEVTEKQCVFFIALYDDAHSNKNTNEINDQTLKNRLGNFQYSFELIISSLIHKKKYSKLKSTQKKIKQKQSVWLESLDWLIKSSIHLEETDYDEFYTEAIFQLSLVVKSDHCVIYRCNTENKELSLLSDLPTSEFTKYVEELFKSDISLVKGSFTEFHQPPINSNSQNTFHHTLLFPLFFSGDLRMMVAIGKQDFNFDSDESVFSGLFCDGIQRALERRNFVNSIKRKNEKLTKEKDEQKSLINKLHETQEQLFQQEKMASIGQLAAGVAHEINNPVGYVNSNISTLEIYVSDILSVFDFLDSIIETEPNYKYLKEKVFNLKSKLDVDFIKKDCFTLIAESKEGILRVKDIVQDLKDFSHVDEATWQDADIVKGIESTLNIVSSELKYKANITKNYGSIPLVNCVPPQINQVIMNILVNAAHAISDHGEISITTYRVNESKIAVEIKDNGSGISKEHLNKIFDPFFTTKPVGTGTGLGLSLSYSIIEKHGGQLKCDSKIGSGSTFTIILPISRLNTEA